MKRAHRKVLSSITACVFTLIAIFFWMTRPMTGLEESINPLSADHLIAHGGGAINGYTYTNSKEALLQSIDKGYRFIELDLYTTSDSVVVCLHNLEEFNKMTGSNFDELSSEIFVKSKFYGRYTPMTLQDAIEIWNDKPFYFVTDNISDPSTLNRYFSSNRDKVVVEAFNTKHYKELEDQGYRAMLLVAGNWIGLKRYIMASIRCRSIVKWIVSGSNADYSFYRFVKRMGTKVATFTENDDDYITRYVGREVDLVYTDSISPNKN